MSPYNYGLLGARAANAYGMEDTEPQRASDRLKQRVEQRKKQLRGNTRLGASQDLPKATTIKIPDPEPMEASGGVGSAVGSALGSTAMGAFGLLDLPGSMIRDVLTLNNPLDQLLSPFDLEKNRVTGEDMAKQYGLYSQEEPTSTLGKIGRFAGGMGLEIATDPLTYLTGGLSAAVKGSKAAKAAGRAGLIDEGIGAVNERLLKAAEKKLGKKVGKREAMLSVTPEELASTRIGVDDVASELGKAKDAKKANTNKFDSALGELIDTASEAGQKQADDLKTKALTDAYLRFNIPFSDKGISFFKGDKAKKVARVMDNLGEAARFGKYSPIFRTAPAFSKALDGAKTVQGQKDALMQADRIVEAVAIARERVSEPLAEVRRIALPDDGNPLTPDQIAKSNKLYEYMEDIGRPRVTVGEEGSRVTRPTEDSLEAWRSEIIANDDTGILRDLEKANVLRKIDTVKQEYSDALQRAERAGLDLTELQDNYSSYTTRLTTKADRKSLELGRKVYDTTTERNTARKNHRRNIKGGTASLQRMSLDERFAGKGKEAGSFEQFIGPEGYGNVLEDLSQAQKKTLYQEVISRSADDVSRGVGFYVENPIEAALYGLEGLYSTTAKASGLRDLVRKSAKISQRSMNTERVVSEANEAFGQNSVAAERQAIRTAADKSRDAFGDLAMGKLDIRREAGDGTGGGSGYRPPPIDPTIGPKDGTYYGYRPTDDAPVDEEVIKEAKSKATKIVKGEADETAEEETAEIVETLAKGTEEDRQVAKELVENKPEVKAAVDPEVADELEATPKKKKGTSSTSWLDREVPVSHETPSAPPKTGNASKNPRKKGSEYTVVTKVDSEGKQRFNYDDSANANIQPVESFVPLIPYIQSEPQIRRIRKIFGKDRFTFRELLEKISESRDNLTKAQRKILDSGAFRKKDLKQMAKTLGMNVTPDSGSTTTIMKTILGKQPAKVIVDAIESLKRGDQIEDDIVEFLRQNEGTLRDRHPQLMEGLDFGAKRTGAKTAVVPRELNEDIAFGLISRVPRPKAPTVVDEVAPVADEVAPVVDDVVEEAPDPEEIMRAIAEDDLTTRTVADINEAEVASPGIKEEGLRQRVEETQTRLNEVTEPEAAKAENKAAKTSTTKPTGKRGTGLAGRKKIAKQTNENEAKRRGLASESTIAQIVDEVSAQYSPTLTTASRDFATIVRDRKPKAQSMEDFLSSEPEALSEILLQAKASNRYEELMTAARDHDNALARYSSSAMEYVNEDAAREYLDMLGVNMPSDVSLRSREGNDMLVRLAREAELSGNPATAEGILEVARPLSDRSGKFLGSTSADDYTNPIAVAEYAKKVTGYDHLNDYDGYGSLDDLIQSEPESFARIVASLKDEVNRQVDSSISFSDSADPSLSYFRQVQALKAADGPENSPFFSSFLDRLGRFAKEDTDLLDDGVLNSMGLRADEVEDLNLTGFFARGPRTRAELIDHVRANAPDIQVVNDGKIARVPFGRSTAPGGDPSTAMEVFVTKPGQEGFGHLRANVYTDLEGKRWLRVQLDPSSANQNKALHILGMKSMMQMASDRNLAGVALVDGADVARAAKKETQDLASRGQHAELGEDFNRYVVSRGGDNGVTAQVADEMVDGEKLKLTALNSRAWSVGNDRMGKPVTIRMNEETGGYYVMRDGLNDESFAKQVQSEEPLTLVEAKQIAADAINETPEGNFSRTVTKWELTPGMRQSSVGRTFYQSNPSGSGRKARIDFPGDQEDWMTDANKTVITAFDNADPLSFAHEMGHIWFASLRSMDPNYLDRVKSIMNIGDRPVTEEDIESFADFFMDWVANGGKSADQSSDTMWTRFKDFIGESYRTVRRAEIEDNITKEMHSFFDDVLKDSKYVEFGKGDTDLLKIMDSLKHSSPRALARYLEDVDPSDLKVAETNVLQGRVRSARESAKRKAESDGIFNADQLIPSEEALFSQLARSVNASDAGKKSMSERPESIKLSTNSPDISVEVKTRVSDQEIVSQFDLPQEIADDIQRVYRKALSFTGDDMVVSWLDMYDKFTNIFKSSVTTPWPAFHARNVIGGAIQLALNDVFDPATKNIFKFFRPVLEGGHLLMGNDKAIKGLDKVAVLKDAANPADEARRLAFAYGVFDSPGQHRDLYGKGRQVGSMVLDNRTVEGKSLASQMKNFVKSKIVSPDPVQPGQSRLKRFFDRANPANIEGGLGSQDRFIGQQAGAAIGDLSEGSLRLGGFLALLKQGYDPAEAARRVKLLQVDYSNLSEIERTTLRRIFPFYTYAKGISKYFVNEIYNRPGGAIAQTMRFQSRSSQPDPMTPEYIRSGTSIRLPNDGADGTRHYLTGLGLMHEPAMSMADRLTSMSPTKISFGVASAANPALKGLGEMITGVSLFQESPMGGGRDLDDMDPLLGRTLSNVGQTVGLYDSQRPVRTPKLAELVIANSPASRVLSTTRQLFDPRKGVLSRAVNFGTGFKVSSVSPAAQDRELRIKAESLMRELGGRSFERVYIPDEELAAMSPSERQKAEELKEIMKVLSDRAKERARVREMEQVQLQQETP